MAVPIGVVAVFLTTITVPVVFAQVVADAGIPVVVIERLPMGLRLAGVGGKFNSVVRLDPPGEFFLKGIQSQIVQSTSDNSPMDGVQLASDAGNRFPRGYRYFITNLGTLGGTESSAYAINDSDQVVGSSLTMGDAASHSFLYSNGQMRDLSPLNSGNLLTAGPTGINNSGEIVSGVIVGGVYVPAIFDSNTGKIRLIGSLGGVTNFGFNGVATSINSAGHAVGYSYLDASNRHAFLYKNGVLSDIGSFGGYSGALAINDQDVIAGFASDQSNGTARAFVFSNGVMTELDPSGIPLESYANGINNSGQVVGEFLTTSQDSFHAFLYSGGTFTDLGFAGSPETNASAINDQGQIVGGTLIAYQVVCPPTMCIQYKPHAFVYKNGALVDLNRLIPQNSGWELSWAFGINNNGNIVGSGMINEELRAFMLIPAISPKQCQQGGWQRFGFGNQGQCIRFVNVGD
jgi:probable HAF family extracellular repeat protein